MANVGTKWGHSWLEEAYTYTVRYGHPPLIMWKPRSLGYTTSHMPEVQKYWTRKEILDRGFVTLSIGPEPK